MTTFLKGVKNFLHIGNNDAKKKKVFNNIRMDTDPEEFWDMVGDLGDGAFGKVYKVRAWGRALDYIEMGVFL